jgi:hypothetical protein
VTSRAQNDDDQPRTIGRRRIVRSAATVAWAVPAIQIATAVPAFAASGCCNVTLTGDAHWRDGGLNYLDIPLNLANGCDTTVSGLTVTLTICGIDDITYSNTDNLPAGWTQAGRADKKLDASGGCYTLTYVSAMSLDGHGSTSPQLTVKSMAYVGSGHHRPAGTITATVSTAGCTSAPVAILVASVD